MLYAEVLLPLPLTDTFTYAVPPEMAQDIRVGSRVIVPFGRKKFYTAIVTLTHSRTPEGFDVKHIAMLLDGGKPLVRHPQLKLWSWLADYYLCAVGDVYKAAVPSGLKMESETFLEVNDNYEEDPHNPLTEREAIVYQVLEHTDKRMTVAEIEKASGLKNLAGLTTKLLQKGAIIVSERLLERYQVKRVPYVRLCADKGDLSRLHELFTLVSRAPKQEKALQTLVALSDFTRTDTPEREVSRQELLERADLPTTILSAMAAKGILEVYRKEINRFRYSGPIDTILPSLSPAQDLALKQIHDSWLTHNVTLLHGVTSSGKTELYIHLIDATLRLKRQVLMLVPEIALTTQLAHRLQRAFGHKVLVYHSKFSDNDRVDLWRLMLDDSSPRVILGARSSVFLPFASLGLVIVDEEHEISYKQQDPAPRYNARDAAIVLATMHGAKVLLGSATPSVETYYKATEGDRYGLVTLSERYDGATLPAIEIVDMSAERRSKASSGPLALRTQQCVSNTLQAGRQAILFINRRGYAPVARCKVCAHIPKCHNCDVAMTYHRSRGLLVCHYCGATQQVPTICPACKEPAIEVIGYGSERIEDEVAEAFPTARIARMDLDTTRCKDGYENIIETFSSGKADILVGTQMVTKGLDFARVDMVGVINADSLLNFPDYRASERAFDLIEQVAGRAGRTAQAQGIVTVQTLQPANPIFPFLQAHDYEGFYRHEIEQRRTYHYPPFTRLINIYIKHRDAATVARIADLYGVKLRELFGTRVQGPQEPTVARIQSLYIRRLMLKIETRASMAKVRAILIDLRNTLAATHPDTRTALTYFDVDPT